MEIKLLGNFILSIWCAIQNYCRGRGEDFEKKFTSRAGKIFAKGYSSWASLIGSLFGLGYGIGITKSLEPLFCALYGFFFAYPYLVLWMVGTGGFMQTLIRDKDLIKMKEWILLDWLATKLTKTTRLATNQVEEANQWGFWYSTLFGGWVFAIPFVWFHSLSGALLMSCLGLYMYALRLFKDPVDGWKYGFEFGWMLLYTFSLQYLFV